MIPKEKINRQNLIEYLSKGICKVVFRKVTNGQFRSMYCTLNEKTLTKDARRYLPRIFKPSQEDDIDIVPVFDIIKNDWRSFRLRSVEYFYDTKELIKRKEIK
jgi:hypothetical protein